MKKSNVIILANHGTVSFGETVERAYWWTEVLDAYCRILMLAKGLGRVNYFTEPEAKALLDLKGKWGMTDPRQRNEELRHLRQRRLPRELEGDRRRAVGLLAAELQEQRHGQRRRPQAAAREQEALIQAITDRVLAELGKRQ